MEYNWDKMIDDMVKEDNSSTIKDFIELKKEILLILSASDEPTLRT